MFGILAQKKQCTGCGEVKSLDKFVKDNRIKDGRQSKCKACYAKKSREYRKNHPDKVLASNRAYRANNPDKVREISKRNRDSNPELYRAINRKSAKKNYEKNKNRAYEWVEENRALVNLRSRLRRLLHPERYRAAERKWQKSHPEIHARKQGNRRARLNGSVGKITAAEIKALVVGQDYTCLCCLRREPEIELTHDHVKPLAMGGDNTIANSQMLCRSCNSRKGAKWIDYR